MYERGIASHKRRETLAQEARRNMIRRADGNEQGENMEPVQPMTPPPEYSAELQQRIRESIVRALGKRFPYIRKIKLFVFSEEEEKRLGCDGQVQLDSGKIGISVSFTNTRTILRIKAMIDLGRTMRSSGSVTGF